MSESESEKMFELLGGGGGGEEAGSTTIVEPTEGSVSGMSIDLQVTLSRAMSAINNQLTQAASDDSRGVTMRDLERSKTKSANVLDAVGKVIQLAHLQELVMGDSSRFRREAEMKVLNPLLAGLQQAALIAQKTMASIAKQIDRELSRDDSNDTDAMSMAAMSRIDRLQEAYSSALDNLGKTVTTTQKTIKLERESGGRENDKLGKALNVAYLTSLDEGSSVGSDKATPGGSAVGVEHKEPPRLGNNGNPNPAVRKLTNANMRSLLLTGLQEKTKVPLPPTDPELLAVSGVAATVDVDVSVGEEEVNTADFEDISMQEFKKFNPLAFFQFEKTPEAKVEPKTEPAASPDGGYAEPDEVLSPPHISDPVEFDSEEAELFPAESILNLDE